MQKVVLSVEDDDAAYHLLEIAFDDIGKDFNLYRVIDGEQAIAFLRRSGSYSNTPKPDLILLNLNLPRISGFDVLEAMQRDNSIRDIPAVAFSSSSLSADRARCLALGAKHFVSKPTDFDEFMDAVKLACKYAAA